jgi:3-methyladenine DNA glycosylase/8-oxoguanine DNA glycosylase
VRGSRGADQPALGDHERAWRRLLAFGASAGWTVEMLALDGHGRVGQVPVGDLGYLKLVGRLRTGNSFARAAEEEMRDFFSPYDLWAG